jgi:hypothetical protein
MVGRQEALAPRLISIGDIYPGPPIIRRTS